MGQFYKILTADPLGEPYTPGFAGAKPTQSYWCQFEGVDNNVMMGKQVGNVPIPGSHVYGDLMYAKSQKGNEYWKFKSAKVPDGVQRPQDAPKPSGTQQYADNWSQEVGGQIPAWAVPLFNMIEAMAKDIKELKGEDVVEEPLPPTLEPEPISEEEKTMLDDIFGTPEAVPAKEED